MAQVDRNIEALLSEERVFEPSEEFASRAVVQDPTISERAEADLRGSGPSRRTGSPGSAAGRP